MTVGDYNVRIDVDSVEVSVSADEVDNQIAKVNSRDSGPELDPDDEDTRREVAQSIGASKIRDDGITGMTGVPDYTVFQTVHEGTRY